MALTELQNSGRQARVPLAGLTAHVRTGSSDSGDRSLAQKIAGAAFLIRVFSAGLIYLSQILLARWMGSFEFGIYVYVWTLVLVIGDSSDLGLATAAQRFIPEYAERGAFELLRGYLSRSRWLAVGSATRHRGGRGRCDPSAAAVAPELPRVRSRSRLRPCRSTASCISRTASRARFNWVHIALVPPYVLRHLVMLVRWGRRGSLQLPGQRGEAVLAVATALMVTAIGQTWVLNRKLGRVEAGPKQYDIRNWIALSVPMFAGRQPLFDAECMSTCCCSSNSARRRRSRSITPR